MAGALSALRRLYLSLYNWTVFLGWYPLLQSLSLSLVNPITYWILYFMVSGCRYCILLSRLSTNQATRMFTKPLNAHFFLLNPPPFWRFTTSTPSNYYYFFLRCILNSGMHFSHFFFFFCSLNWILEMYGATDSSWSSRSVSLNFFLLHNCKQDGL